MSLTTHVAPSEEHKIDGHGHDRAAGVSSEYFWKLVNKRKTANSSNIGCEIK